MECFPKGHCTFHIVGGNKRNPLNRNVCDHARPDQKHGPDYAKDEADQSQVGCVSTEPLIKRCYKYRQCQRIQDVDLRVPEDQKPRTIFDN